MAESEGLVIRWGDTTYTGGMLTAADMIAMEEEWGDSFERIDFSTMKATCWVVWLVRRHDDPDLPLEDVTSITLTALEQGAAEEPPPVPPTSGSRKRASKSGKSGSRSTARSSA